jgi:hypothetical protein
MHRSLGLVLSAAFAFAWAGCGGDDGTTDTGVRDSSGGGCEIMECFRAVECAATCGGPILSSSCCPCPAGQVDVAIDCEPAPCEDTPGCVTVCEGGDCSCQCSTPDAGADASPDAGSDAA